MLSVFCIEPTQSKGCVGFFCCHVKKERWMLKQSRRKRRLICPNEPWMKSEIKEVFQRISRAIRDSDVEIRSEFLQALGIPVNTTIRKGLLIDKWLPASFDLELKPISKPGTVFITDWSLEEYNLEEGEPLEGVVVDHPRFAEGQRITTAILDAASFDTVGDADDGLPQITTLGGTRYRLGMPSRHAIDSIIFCLDRNCDLNADSAWILRLLARTDLLAISRRYVVEMS